MSVSEIAVLGKLSQGSDEFADGFPWTSSPCIEFFTYDDDWRFREVVILHQLNKLSQCLVGRLARRYEIPYQLIGSGSTHAE